MKWCLWLLSVSFAVSPLAGEEIVKREPMKFDFSPYLYKILSLRSWHATEIKKKVELPGEDELFIHLAKKDQVDRVIAKRWADASEVVVLKLDKNKLKGDLVYETNPGGYTNYYHLYNGFIPYSAIVEARIVYLKQREDDAVQGLDIVKAGDLVLRSVARELSIEEILSPEIQTLIAQMTETMRKAPGVGLAAPQIGQSIQLAVIEDMDQSHLTAEQIKERERYPVPFHVIINPRLYVEGEESVEFFEGCLSVDCLMGMVPRARFIKVECLNEKGEPITIHATGWYARILQHEIDHLHGRLYIDRAYLPTVMTDENYARHWRGKGMQEIKASLVSQDSQEVFYAEFDPSGS